MALARLRGELAAFLDIDARIRILEESGWTHKMICSYTRWKLQAARETVERDIQALMAYVAEQAFNDDRKNQHR